ncbi:hypothetical protein RSOLAG22IIIB_05777 [Rhizoctonia solani]|uniref:Uncharacterized protein n=1 Tax=Rhizoctonia solani TaxID=456999 RepID=A0A0K6GA07_9AGAM|nr:hypothetical protein RSOLAG22IIIB_05777 [Rhizoctonia solani]
MAAHDAHVHPDKEPVEIPRLNDTTGYNTYDSDDARSDYLCGSRYHVPTPPPSPLCSPSPNQDSFQVEAPELEDEGGFCNITAGDFCEYEQCYAEDHPFEDAGMLAESLMDAKLNSIIMLAIC